MRLICPNCEAEYEVDDAAIPDMGRDVQCSNCGHAWFQLPPEIELALEQEDELFGASGAVDPLTDLDEEDDTPPPPPAGMADTPKRSMDENLMAVLREEAEREAAARKAESGTIETQTEMGLSAPAAAAAAAAAAAVVASAEQSSAAGVVPTPAHAGGLAAAARRIAQMKGLDPDAPPPAPPKPAARRDLLPDIEEINSSLKGAEPPVMADGDMGQSGQSNARGFRNGFAVAMLVAVVALAAYVAAPRIVAMVPATEGVVNAYVSGVDGLRLWLDGVMRSATDALRQMSSQGS
jgi:predicted Zn finger-like uncharacterized protein